jgi:predicted signal transduction protein with EAL and GGDEF domain
VAQIAERIRQRIEATIISVAPGVTDHITVSIGIANAPEHGTDRVTLLRLADEALYEAKATGRNRVVAIGDRRGRVSIEPAVKSTGRRHRSPDVGDDLPMVGATG